MSKQAKHKDGGGTISEAVAGAHRFSHDAMATTFEVLIADEDADYARQSAYGAFKELDRLEQELSRFIENSDISRINALGFREPVVVGCDTLECLRQCSDLHIRTNGAFDITVGALSGCRLNGNATVRSPSSQQRDDAHRCTGLDLVQVDEGRQMVKLLADGVQLDLGGFAKGYAVDRMAELLREWGIRAALVNGGCSSLLAMEGPCGTAGWPVRLSHPKDRSRTLGRFCLCNKALGSSGLQQGMHIIDPHSRRPAVSKQASWVVTSTAATADGLSTAFMIMPPEQIELYCESQPGTFAMVVMQEGEMKGRVLRFASPPEWTEG